MDEPFESGFHHLVCVELDVAPERAYDGFCALERIGEWLPGVRVLEVQEQYPDGSPELVRFESTLEGSTFEYTLRYVYDRGHLRLAWHTRHEDPYTFQGHCQFVDRSGRTFMLYTFFEPQDDRAMHSRTRSEREAYAQKVTAAFKTWVR